MFDFRHCMYTYREDINYKHSSTSAVLNENILEYEEGLRTMRI